MAKPVTRLIIPSEEDNIKLMKMAEEYGYCTVWDLCKKYNINKQKIYLSKKKIPVLFEEGISSVWIYLPIF